jgi:hypothetical protein
VRDSQCLLRALAHGDVAQHAGKKIYPTRFPR